MAPPTAIPPPTAAPNGAKILVSGPGAMTARISVAQPRSHSASVAALPNSENPTQMMRASIGL